MRWWNRREVWLGVLCVALVAVLYHQARAWLVPSLPPDLLAPGAPAPDRGRGLAAEAVPEVRLDALAALRSTYDPRGRNLFQYGQKPAPLPPPPPPEEVLQEQLRRQREEEEQRRRVEEIVRQRQEAEAKRLAEQQAMQPQQQVPPQQAAGPAPSAANYKFVGYMGKPQDKIAVLLYEGEVVLVKEGERLGKEFVVREIRFESVELGYTDPRFKDQSHILPMGN